MKRFTNACVRYVERLMPDPFLLAVLLTVVAVAAVFLFVPHTAPGGLLDAWFSGVWGKNNIFAFALQMIIILVGGYTVAEAPIVQRGLDRVAALPKSQFQAALVCFFAAAIASLINWGLGLVVGALVARRVALRMPDIHFGYLVAAGYAGFIVWASGFSSSIALANTDPTSSLNVIQKLTGRTISLWDALAQPSNWAPVLVMLVAVPLLPVDAAAYGAAAGQGPVRAGRDRRGLRARRASRAGHGRIHPRRSRYAADRRRRRSRHGAHGMGEPDGDRGGPAAADVGPAPGEHVDHQRGPGGGRPGVLRAQRLHRRHHLHGDAVHGPRPAAARDARAVHLRVHQRREDRRSAGAAVPLYGGIIALLAYAPSADTHSLAVVISNGISSAANATTLPFFHFLASDIITLFVPSGGGHWAVQGPVAIQSAIDLNQTSPGYLGKLSMSVAAGEQVANMIQPFWLLPVLAIARLSVRDVMGFTVVIFLVGLVVFGLAFLLIPAVG